MISNERLEEIKKELISLERRLGDGMNLSFSEVGILLLALGKLQVEVLKSSIDEDR